MAGSLLAVKAEEILRKIEDGKPVEYENVLIFGDLDLYRLDLPCDEDIGTVVSSIIKIEYSIIKGDVFFDRSTFSNLVDFDGTIFTKVPTSQRANSAPMPGSPRPVLRVTPTSTEPGLGPRPTSPGPGFRAYVDFRSVAFDKNLNLDSAKGSVIRLSDVTFGEGSYI